MGMADTPTEKDRPLFGFLLSDAFVANALRHYTGKQRSQTLHCDILVKTDSATMKDMREMNLPSPERYSHGPGTTIFLGSLEMTDIQFLESPSIRPMLSGKPGHVQFSKNIGKLYPFQAYRAETEWRHRYQSCENEDRPHPECCYLVMVEAKKKGMVSSGLAQSAIGIQVVGSVVSVPSLTVQFDFVLLDELRQYSVITYRWNAGQKGMIRNTFN
ncbi:hypothetical protein BP00DRAFT_449077 [Aspergillus indologenus CBS 114.80]|uniref:Uncharacterized protein n=1 Tax=Aspergillus indologenus CBS 114.80 TaxID=1450541 RepID=A0A2V5IWW6_9EURO|nr:hypothetical protein BP00DRAFT_449077 [Aspergillus indologenus CBS 114.80]